MRFKPSSVEPKSYLSPSKYSNDAPTNGCGHNRVHKIGHHNITSIWGEMASTTRGSHLRSTKAEGTKSAFAIRVYAQCFSPRGSCGGGATGTSTRAVTREGGAFWSIDVSPPRVSVTRESYPVRRVTCVTQSDRDNRRKRNFPTFTGMTKLPLEQEV